MIRPTLLSFANNSARASNLRLLPITWIHLLPMIFPTYVMLMSQYLSMPTSIAASKPFIIINM
ncbi:hypothetical protein LINPERPRIM_LOCUS28734 [Linum perenne]